MNSFSVEEMLGIWWQGQSGQPGASDIHPAKEIIRKLARGEDFPDRERLEEHVSLCSKCLMAWYSMLEEENEETGVDGDEEYPLPLACDSQGVDDLFSLDSPYGSITFRKDLEHRDAHLAELELNPDLAVEDGELVTVVNPQGKILLEGVLIAWKVSGWVKNIKIKEWEHIEIKVSS